MGSSRNYVVSISLSLTILLFQNCGPTSFNSESNLSSEASTSGSGDQNSLSCLTTEGTQLAVGESIQGFPFGTAVFPNLCGSPVTRTCNSNGQFDGSVPLFGSCSQQCVHPASNQAVSQGAEFVYFTRSSGATQSECDAARVTSVCQASGQFSPSPAAQRFSSCLVAGQTCAYTASTGTSVPSGNNLGATVTGFPLQSATYPILCGSQMTLTCAANGSWGGAVPLFQACAQKCVHPQTNMPVDANNTYSYYTIAQGTLSQCNAAKVTTTCQASTGMFSPAVSAARYSTCTVSEPASSTQKACLPIPGGRDLQVGDGKEYPELNNIPWTTLKAGDTIRVFYRATPYRSRFRLNAQGTATAPVRLCGVKGPNGERPIISGTQAQSNAGSDPKALIFLYGSGGKIPQYIEIDGLRLTGNHPNYGSPKFGACVFVGQGQNIRIADNEIHDCNQAVFSASIDGSETTLTRNLQIIGNNFYDNGVSGSFLEHTTYIQSLGVVYEFNRYGPLKTGATGNGLKDRSAGVTIRYNVIEAGTRSLDLVDAEEYKETALASNLYPFTYVYGNIFHKVGREVVHYGGDHPGFEKYYRKGTLYFFNNTILASGNAKIFMISTLDETVQAWNNVFYFSSGIATLREPDGYYQVNQTGGRLILGRNWINTGYRDASVTLPNAVVGLQNLVTGAASPIEPSTLDPKAGSALIDSAVMGPLDPNLFKVNFQIFNTGAFPMVSPRATVGGADDLGAIEKK